MKSIENNFKFRGKLQQFSALTFTSDPLIIRCLHSTPFIFLFVAVVERSSIASRGCRRNRDLN